MLRNVRRLAVLLCALATMLLAAPLVASANIGDKGSPDPLSPAEKIGYFIAIPFGILVIFVLVFMRPGSGGATRYRPQRGWEAKDAWFGVSAPAAAAPAVEAVADADAAADETGGSRGSW